MTLYQELQLDQKGSKALLHSATSRQEALRHGLIYLLKIVLTLAFCMSVVLVYTACCGQENSIVGVVVVLFLMVFRYADFSLRITHALPALAAIFGILIVGPQLAHLVGSLAQLPLNFLCLTLLMLLGCSNVKMGNQLTLVLAYLLLFGYPASGTAFVARVEGLVVGAVLTGLVYAHNHHHKSAERTLKHLMLDLHKLPQDTVWKLSCALSMACVISVFELLGLGRSMWAAIAVMSVMVPNKAAAKQRVKGRIYGNVIGAVLFFVLYPLMPASLHPYIGVLGGIGVGLSALYGNQAIFNSLGAMSMATNIYGLTTSVVLRVVNNAVGSLFGFVMLSLQGKGVQALSLSNSLEEA